MSTAVAAEEEKKPVPAYGWAARDSSGVLSPFHFSRRENGDNDITVRILYCGICHTDLHLLKNKFGISTYPMVPGHEIVGEVIKVGSSVTKFSVGDKAGVTGIVGTCGSCSNCNQGMETYCPKLIITFGGHYHVESVNYGGYSDKMVVNDAMKYYGLDKSGLHLGVVGLGGLGHVAVKFAKAFNIKVTVLSTSIGKRKEALEQLGADEFLLSNDQKQLQDAMNTMDGIIDRISAPHSLHPLVRLLKTNGKLILVGITTSPPDLPSLALITGRKMIGGSSGGGMRETQEMIDFAAKHNITAQVEVIPMDYVNTALGRLANNDVKYRTNGEKDVTLKVLYCGIGHSDIHFSKNELGMSIYPLVPGHELVGEVREVGSSVTKFSVGDIAGVGALVGSCGSCYNCDEGLENYCPKSIYTLSSRYHDGSITYGGYSDHIVVEEHFAVFIPKTLPLDGTAPLLSAGITVYSPMKLHGLDKPGLHLGVVGLGGLGHMAVKFAKAFNMKVTIMSTSPTKKEEALERLCADAFLLSNQQEELQDARSTMDGIIDTVSAPHSLYPLVDLLKTRGKLIMVGAATFAPELPYLSLLRGGKIIGSSLSGGLKETQEMIDFAAKHNVTAEVEVIPMDYVNTANERILKNDVKYRFVIDVANTLKSPTTTTI
ncbi:hypothetical protein L6164_027351 [Bauhinia variegata]|uniref:Uncharacterized protein n=1 Tax=Bauhinia variegata TaxID=167791 RepID=A0ACB9LT45_BAUVA|nr:hypothetical protein L6164_027351 [Bauhinia variegata]